MSEEDTSKRKKRIYKYFLDPTYKRSKVDPRTDKRWRNIMSTTDINIELGIILLHIITFALYYNVIMQIIV